MTLFTYRVIAKNGTQHTGLMLCWADWLSRPDARWCVTQIAEDTGLEPYSFDLRALDYRSNVPRATVEAMQMRMHCRAPLKPL